MASYYEHDYAAFGVEVLQAAFMVAEMEQRAEQVKAAAIAIAPVGNPENHWYAATGRSPGEYKASFVVSSGIGPSGGKGSRAFGRVTNTSDHAAAVEFGYGPVPRYRVLGKSLGAAGGDGAGGEEEE